MAIDRLIRGLGISLLSLSLATGVSPVMAGEEGSYAQRYASAVELARAGESEKALAIFTRLHQEYPRKKTLLYEKIVVLSWAERDAEALALAHSADIIAAPAYTVAAAAKSARNLGEFATAAELYLQVLRKDSADTNARAGLAMTYVDAQAIEQAHNVIAEAPASVSQSTPLLLARAYALEHGTEFVDALAVYQRLLEREPGNREALRGKALVLRELLLPQDALALAAQHPGILSEAEIANLEVDAAALRIRFGTETAFPPDQRYAGTDRALAEIDALLEREDLSEETRLRLRQDRVVALTDRKRTREAVTEFESLVSPAAEMPTHVRISASKAYLAEERPEEALELLQSVLAAEPYNYEARFQLFWVYSDLEDFDKAFAVADALLADLPERRALPDSRVEKGSPEYLRAMIISGLAQAYADQLDASQSHFEDMLGGAPHNADLRSELAAVYRWRGWPERALFEYSQVRTLSPDMYFGRIGYAHTLLDLQDWRAAEEEILYLDGRYGSEPQVRRLRERWKLHRRGLLEVYAEAGESSGPTFGEDQYTIEAAYYTRPLAYHYRAILRTHDAFGEFPEGSYHRRRMGAGFDYRKRRWTGKALVNTDRDGGDTGIYGSLDYRINDFWRVGGFLETDSELTPLRGERAGVASDVIGASAEYRPNELASFTASFSLQDFSDGNSGSNALLASGYRILNRPTVKLTLLGDVSLERRDRDDVAYFSPLRGFTWSAGARGDWRMFRRYERGYTHSLTGRVGRYDQAGFSAGGIWSAEYEFRAELGERWSSFVGLRRSSNVYDSDREYATFFLAGLRGRL